MGRIYKYGEQWTSDAGRNPLVDSGLPVGGGRGAARGFCYPTHPRTPRLHGKNGRKKKVPILSAGELLVCLGKFSCETQKSPTQRSDIHCQIGLLLFSTLYPTLPFFFLNNRSKASSPTVCLQQPWGNLRPKSGRAPPPRRTLTSTSLALVARWRSMATLPPVLRPP